MKLLYYIIVATLFFISLQLFAEDDWKFSSIDFSRSGNTLSVSGRVQGKECSQLKVTITVEDDKGHKERIIAIAGNVNTGGSKIFSGKTKTFSKSLYWKTADISARCSWN